MCSLVRRLIKSLRRLQECLTVILAEFEDLERGDFDVQKSEDKKDE